jgi:hypothetical protein
LLLPLFLVTFLLVRIHVLFYPQSSGWAVVDDELPTGNIAVDLGQRLLLPAPAYQFKPFAAGTMLEGVLSYPFRQWLGPNLLALKAAPLTLQTLALLFWLLALWRAAGPAAAITFGLLYIFSPPTWLHLSHMAWANHAEQSFFLGLIMLLLTYAWHGRGAGNPPHPATSFLCGLTAGLGTYFSYSGLPGVIWLVVVLVLIGGRNVWQRQMPMAAAGIVAGLAPLAWSTSYFGARAMGLIDTYTGYAAGALVTANQFFTEQNLGYVPAKLARLVFVDLPTCSLYPGRGDRWFFFLVVIAALVSWLVLRRKTWALMLRGIGRGGLTREGLHGLLQIAPLLYAIIFTTIFVFSGFRVLTPEQPKPAYYGHYRYLAPLFPIAFALIGLGVQALWNALERRVTGRLLLAAAGAISLLAVSVPYYRGLARGPFAIDALEVRGDDYLPVIERLAIDLSRSNWSRNQKIAHFEQLPRRYQHLFFELMGKIGDSGFSIGLQIAPQNDDRFVSDLVRGYGRITGALLAEGQSEAWTDKADWAMQKVNLSNDPHRLDYLTGVGMGLSRAMDLAPGEVLAGFKAWRTTRPADYSAIAAGVGQFAGATLSIDILEDTKLPDEFWFGYGRQIRQNAETMLLSWRPVSNTIMAVEHSRRRQILAGFVLEGARFENP